MKMEKFDTTTAENDGLTVNYNKEIGEFQLEWDPNDSRWSWLNDLTGDEVGAIITEYLEHRLDELTDGDAESSV